MDFLSNGWWLLFRCFCRVTVLITVSVQRDSVHFCFCALWKCKKNNGCLSVWPWSHLLFRKCSYVGNKSNANKLNLFFLCWHFFFLHGNNFFFLVRNIMLLKKKTDWETRTKSAILEQKSKSIVTSIVWVTPSIIRCMFQYLLLEGFIRSLLWQGSSSNSLQLYKADTSGSWNK